MSGLREQIISNGNTYSYKGPLTINELEDMLRAITNTLPSISIEEIPKCIACHTVNYWKERNREINNKHLKHTCNGTQI